MIGPVVAMAFFVGIAYCLLLQVQFTMTIVQKDRTYSRSSFIGNIVCGLSLAIFLVSYMINGLMYWGILKEGILNSQNTAICCVIFILLAMLSKLLTYDKKVLT
ncbi:hypothetical protein [Ornithinibacillus halophilus]|uniref:Uncharacterized protein n=1 Tax=Ornithinibacillus halophilus TaxID=930117 RepID=A0A1M5JXA0_9BACI|nr:hypothetical protein [Ornithinibacillus halophilus]SHG45212.1 hypothetical protein SAMN05216225_103412 [Ornithinibacillus halophilus]